MENNLNIPGKIATELENWDVEFPVSKEDAWRKINAKIQSNNTPVYRMKKRKMWRPLVAAASIAFVVGLAYILQRDVKVEVQTANNEKVEVVLPDHSIVSLNAASSIQYDKEHWDENREVLLTGEAYFEVEKGSQFHVVSAHGEVTVLGTGFNIYDREDDYRVGCNHGKVRVKSGTSEVILTKSLYSELVSGTLVTPKEKSNINAWLDGKHIFDEITLIQVFAEIERQFDVKINHDVDGSRKFTGTFEQGSLKNALTVVCGPMNLTFEIDESNNNQIIIHNK